MLDLQCIKLKSLQESKNDLLQLIGEQQKPEAADVLQQWQVCWWGGHKEQSIVLL